MTRTLFPLLFGILLGELLPSAAALGQTRASGTSPTVIARRARTDRLLARSQFVYLRGQVRQRVDTTLLTLTENVHLPNGTVINYKSGIVKFPKGKDPITLREGDYVKPDGSVVFFPRKVTLMRARIPSGSPGASSGGASGSTSGSRGSTSSSTGPTAGTTSGSIGTTSGTTSGSRTTAGTTSGTTVGTTSGPVAPPPGAPPPPAPPSRPASADKGFPWPPPPYSANAGLPKDFFAGVTTWGEADDALKSKLSKARYRDEQYYELPQGAGFALVTRFEQIDKQCAALPEPDRWSLDTSPCPGLSLKCIVSSVVFPRSGYWRAFVFVVTDQPLPVARGAQPTSGDAQGWFSNGSNRLPRELRRRPFTADHYGTVLIYEFEKKEAQPVEWRATSRFGGFTHLQRAGILP